MDAGLSAAIIGAAATITLAITAGVFSIIQRNSKLNKIIRYLGFDENEASMKNLLDNRFRQIDEKFRQVDDKFGHNNIATLKSVAEQTGVGTDDKSLTKQHNDLKEIILTRINAQSETINTIYQKIRDEEVRRGNFTVDQKSLLHTVNSLVYDWELTHRRLSEATLKCLVLEAENVRLKQELSELQNSEDN